MPEPSSYATSKTPRKGPANSVAPSGSGKPSVRQRGGHSPLPVTHCAAKRKAFQTGVGAY